MRGARCEVRGARCEGRGARCEVRDARCEMRDAIGETGERGEVREYNEVHVCSIY